jgi:hypothetical protein
MAAVAAGLPAVPVVADSNYVGGEGVGNWSAAENWSPVGVPGEGAFVNFINADGLSRTLNYDYAGPAVKLDSLWVDQTGGGTNTLQIAGQQLTARNVWAGLYGTGSISQSGGTFVPDGDLSLAYDPKSRGTYSLSGGELRAASGSVIVGFGGVGEFVHSGGNHTTPALILGFSTGSSGTYRLSGSTRLEVTGYESIGDNINSGDCVGVFEQSGGTHVASLLLLGGSNVGGGTYRLSDGTLAVNDFKGVKPNGTFEQTGGTHLVDAQLSVGGSATAAATYTISGGELKAKQVLVNSGTSGTARATGTLNVSGGAVTVLDNLTIARGVVNLSGGSLTAAVQNDGVLDASGGTFAGALVNGGTVRASTGAVLTVTGGISGSNAASTAASRLVVETGASVTASYVRQGSLELNGSTTNPPAPAPVLSIRRKADGGATSVVRALAIQTDSQGAPLGQVDLADTALVVDYAPGAASPISRIRSLIAAGRARGAWDGDGLTSSVAASAGAGSRALGYGEAAAVVGPSGGTFEGQAVDGTAVLVRYTRVGDATLDGVVGFGDLLALAKHYNAANAQWGDGDFDYDGVVNFADLLALAKNYNQAVPTEVVAGAPAGCEAALAAAFAGAVPEPSGVGWVVAAGVGLATSRRGRGVRLMGRD